MPPSTPLIFTNLGGVEGAISTPLIFIYLGGGWPSPNFHYFASVCLLPDEVDVFPLSRVGFCGLGIFGIKFREILMKTTVQNNKNSGNFCIFFIQNSGNFYEKKATSRCFFSKKFREFLLRKMAKIPGILKKKQCAQKLQVGSSFCV